MRFLSINPQLGNWISILLLPFSLLLKAGEIELIHESTIDLKALTFASGPATRFGNVVNGRTHQQSPLTSYRGYQYATWFDAERRVCIGRRKLPSGNWQKIQFTDHRFESNDSHNTAVIGICHNDGTIHMAFDHHASKLNYRVSKPGVANHPERFRWDPGLFGKVRHTLGSVKPDARVTYPRFFSTPKGNLMLYYRAVTSANGNGMIEEYNGDRQDWSPGLGKFIARDIGSYTANGETSQYRCPYMNNLSYAGDRLHASWIWRDRFQKTHPRNQHDLCYAYSDDYGRTWHNNDGEVIGRTGTSFIHLNSPGLVVSPIPTDSGLSNQNAQYAYPDNSVHVIHLQRTEGRRTSTYHHHWRSSSGIWKHEALLISGNRPKLVGTKDRTLFLLSSGNRERLQLAKGTPVSGAAGWRWSNIEFPSPQSCYGEALLDLERWEEEKILSIYRQEEPPKIFQTKKTQPIGGLPSALKVLDCHLQVESPD